ncbi:hypothetical protein [Agromyces aerolatus]|uniref:hypothetical protein n=1 Tax=Agromyces sp. LY-1074 TaxID=3074080 RepID=UPI0028598720|nr:MULTISPECIES: hypothetical protein [unclassified Agromyces]MDR5701941.1 hypothetical protein [Agromyces sp. LY-1074]MDR5708168.1 hypothetical protein [Agromyces sp. LY-1358]
MTARSATTASLRLGGTALLACGLLLLGGCASSPEPSASPAPTRTASPSASASAEPSAPAEEPTEAAPAPEPEPEPITCDAVLTPEAATALAEQGLEVSEGATQGYPLAAQFAAAGGTACTWARPDSDVHLTVVQLHVADGEQDAWARVLSENGYTQTDDPVAGAFTGPVDPGTGVSPVVVVEAARMSFVSVPTLVTDLAPAA